MNYIPNETLGHVLSKPVQDLICEVQEKVPHKSLRIQEYAFASAELGRPINSVHSAMTAPEVSDFLAIWIKSELPDPEFQAALAEELIHQIQVHSGRNVVCSVDRMDGNRDAIIDFWTELMSVLLDFEAHTRLHELSLHEPTIAGCLARFENCVLLSEENPNAYASGRAIHSGLPTYLLFHWDLYRLAGDDVKAQFGNLRTRIFNLLPQFNIELWSFLSESLTGDMDKDIEIVAKALNCSVQTTPMKTSGKVLMI